jgi:transposase InsO family protein
LCRRRHNVDNGSEFINWHLLRWCEKEKITFTRSRSGNSNEALLDQAW